MTDTLEDQRVLDLRSLVAAAKRCQHLHRRFELADPPEPLTEWDRRHADIDALLDDMVGR